MLSRDHGLLFVYDREADTRTFVMRGMRCSIDIVFIDETGTVAAVHLAVREPGTAKAELTRYAGRARWGLEVPNRSTHRHAIVPDTSFRTTGPEHAFTPALDSAASGELELRSSVLGSTPYPVAISTTGSELTQQPLPGLIHHHS